MVRVIAGQYRGRMLVAPQGRGIRLTSDRVKEALFNILAPRVNGASFLDLFAGTGSVGIEALSRGARSCTFVEKNPAHIRFLRRNISSLSPTPRCRVYRADVFRFLRSCRDTFDIVFADPPYGKGLAQLTLNSIAESGVVARGGVVVIEHEKGAELCLDDRACPLRLERQAAYGDTVISFLSEG